MSGDPILKLYFRMVTGLVIGLGIFGALWLSDEWDFVRKPLYAGIVLPGLILLLAIQIWRPALSSHKWMRLLKATIIAICLWGNLQLLNAISGAKPEVVRGIVSEQLVNVAYKRGGLGWLYRQRW